MFGCAGESKFRLLNSCAKQHKLYTNEHSSSNNQKGSSVISSPLTISNENNRNTPLEEINGFGGSEEGVFEGKL